VVAAGLALLLNGLGTIRAAGGDRDPAQPGAAQRGHEGGGAAALDRGAAGGGVAAGDAKTGKQGVLVDGGVASVFPVFLFDSPAPEHPTWGFRLFAGEPPEKPSYTSIGGPLWPIDMLKAIVDTSMGALDKLELVAFEPRTISIPTGDVPTLDFNLSEAQKQELYEFGYTTAEAFFAAKPDGRNTYGKVPASLAG
jgi:hypothetical protein